MKRAITRRKLLTGLAAAAGWAAFAAARRLHGADPARAAAEGPELEPRAYLPLVMRGYPPTQVVRIHSADATYWDFGTGWHGDYVRQGVVDEMMEQGLMRVTDTPSVTAAWAEILPNYAPGQGIAVKINLNNCYSCVETDNQIDALVEPVNALIRTMVAAGIREQDV